MQGCPASAWRPNCRTPASTPTPSSSRPTKSAALGVTTPIPGCRATSRRVSTRIRSGRTRAGRDSCHRVRRSIPTFGRSRPNVASVGISDSVPKSRRPATGTGSGGSAPTMVRKCSTSSSRRPVCCECRGTRTSPASKPSPARRFTPSRWDHSISLPDKRIGLIGTGSTGVQISAELGGKVRGLKIFQRTAQWVMPVAEPAVLARSRRRRCGAGRS